MRCPGGHTTTVDLVGSNPLIPTNRNSLRSKESILPLTMKSDSRRQTWKYHYLLPMYMNESYRFICVVLPAVGLALPNRRVV